MAAESQKYDESKIKTLSSLEHIRLRSGMYIGRLGDGSNPNDGIYVLIKEVIDNAVDEFIMGHGKRIDIRIEEKRITIRDYGRGIPLGKVVDCVSVINTGAKYNTDVFQFSVGLNGVGLKAVNALSSHFEICSYREKQFSKAIFSQGIKKEEKLAKQEKTHPDGTLVIFEPDPGIFQEFAFNMEYLEERLWNYAYLNQGLSLELYVGPAKSNPRVFKSERGLFDLLEAEVGGVPASERGTPAAAEAGKPDSDEGGSSEGSVPLYEIGYYRGKQIEFAFTHTTGYGENYFSFVNGQHTSDGGTHLSAFREGFLKGINEFFKKDWTGQDVREGLTAALAVKLENPIFESQTKNKLGNTEIRAWIIKESRDAIVDWLHKNAPASRKMQDKIVRNEELRKELAVVRNKAREAAKRVALKIPSLKDCKFHLTDSARNDKEKAWVENSTIFLTEGQSASGSMVSSRDVMTQAIFSLRGKPQNMHGRKRTEIYTNEELFNLTQALGIESDLDGLRYARVVLATDADNDGFHIRNLLLTYFLTYFEELVVREHIWILETPLFRVRNKHETRYCYSEKERDSAATELKSGVEITRFKGLGEINPKEFGQFIGPDIRLVPVNVKSIKGINETLEFYMGKNTPTRRDFIMQNLI